MKYRVDRKFKWMGQTYDRGDAISRDTILAEPQVGEARLGSLQRTGFISRVHPLDKMTKTELVAYGREVGAAVDPSVFRYVARVYGR